MKGFSPKVKLVFLISSILLSSIAIYYYFFPLVPKLKIGNTVYTYDVAITKDQISKGLSGRTALTEKHGMLFIFDHNEQFRFWMKDMTFALDIIWIKDTTVIDITKNVPPPTSPEDDLPQYSPKEAVNRVFELRAGTADKFGIKVGDSVEYLKK